jgi:predicted O-methyltransferase YrrM
VIEPFSPGISLPDEVGRRLATLGQRMGQGSSPAGENLGLGHLYYGLTRLYRPQVVVCVGSHRGFAPVCFTLGLVANGAGTCTFIDPGLVDRFWHDPATIRHLNQTYGLDGRLRHIRKTTQQVVAEASLTDSIDLLYIDGDHSYAGVKYDFDQLGRKVRPGGQILLHDATAVGRGFTRWEVKRFLEAEVYGHPEYETFTFRFGAGLALVRKRT